MKTKFTKHKSMIKSSIALSIMASSFAFAGEYADSIYFGGNILTMESDQPEFAQAVAVKDGRITFVGSQDQVKQHQGDDTRLVNLEGKTMLPGFVDGHSHFQIAVENVAKVDLTAPPTGEVGDMATLVERLKTFQKENNIQKGEWIFGWGYDENMLAEKRHPSIFDLDEAFPDNPVFMRHISQHGASMNSKALEALGIDENFETPDGGVVTRVEGTNKPSGTLFGTALLAVLKEVPGLDDDMYPELVRRAQYMYARNGYTFAQDGALHLDEHMKMLQVANTEGFDIDIASLMLFSEVMKWANNPDVKFGELENGYKVQGMKFVMDGSPQGKTAYFTTPYLTGGLNGEEDWTGKPYISKPAAKQMMAIGFEAGAQLFAHANGDAGIDMLLDIIDEFEMTAEDDHRSVVIHSQFMRPEQLERYVELGMTPNFFTAHTWLWGDAHLQNRGEKEPHFISPVKAALDHGLVYSNQSDYPVTPLDTRIQLWSAMERTTLNGKVLGADQRVDAYTALQGITSGPAWQHFEEHNRGMIKEGLMADFVVLDINPIEATSEEIRQMQVLTTIKQDEVIFEKK